jgi:hypothetical protein
MKEVDSFPPIREIGDENMVATKGIPMPDAVEDVDPYERVEGLIESLTPVIDDCSDRAPLYSTVAMPSSRISTLAVVDDHGQLVPIFTAGDLLFERKAVWKATQS